MDWQAAIGRHGATLRRVVSSLVALFGRDAGAELRAPDASADDRPTLARHRHRRLLRVLRPAEAAVRRLVVVVALALPTAPDDAAAGAAPRQPRGRPPRAHQPCQPVATPLLLPRGIGTGVVLVQLDTADRGFGLAVGPPATGDAADPAVPGWALPSAPKPPRRLRLPLADPVRRLRVQRIRGRDMPRISTPGFSTTARPPAWRAPDPHDRLDATRLVLRIEALADALDDLPREARRLLRWRARRAARFERDRQAEASPVGEARPAPADPRRGRFLSPLRRGRPPGGRRHLDRELRDVRDELHLLARDLLHRPDTS